MTRFVIGPPPARLTRFAGLGYRQDGPGLWRFVDMETGATVGAHYRTKGELFGDLAAFAAMFGVTA